MVRWSHRSRAAVWCALELRRQRGSDLGKFPAYSRVDQRSVGRKGFESGGERLEELLLLCVRALGRDDRALVTFRGTNVPRRVSGEALQRAEATRDDQRRELGTARAGLPEFSPVVQADRWH